MTFLPQRNESEDEAGPSAGEKKEEQETKKESKIGRRFRGLGIWEREISRRKKERER